MMWRIQVSQSFLSWPRMLQGPPLGWSNPRRDTGGKKGLKMDVVCRWWVGWGVDVVPRKFAW